MRSLVEIACRCQDSQWHSGAGNSTQEDPRDLSMQVRSNMPAHARACLCRPRLYVQAPKPSWVCCSDENPTASHTVDQLVPFLPPSVTPMQLPQGTKLQASGKLIVGFLRKH